ncbi:hypothetical protein NEHOM01_1430 [Nematocida homosporus]|uniref:uncharacterized protein n=1 Tax=Nematocida homosporus TaxID=1912981 RepID=UPI00221F3ABD|nr:uncharacterized protein NEHOM01_1430 [Nematocida homosporus]KAI5186376.1 hypothetical protein NEHOM01_1430 [Nematocida homosporus]
MFDHMINELVSINLWRFKKFGRWIGVCVLLVILTGASEPDVGALESLPDSKTVHLLLESIGFTFENGKKRHVPLFSWIRLPTLPPIVNITPHVSYEQPALIAAEDQPLAHVEILLNTPTYEVEYLDRDIRFQLPKYTDVEEAKRALAALRKIAVLRTDLIHITCAAGNPKCHQINQQILSRVLNMVDVGLIFIHLCTELGKEEYVSQIDLAACQAEAQNTLEHATYKVKEQFFLSTLAHDTLPDTICPGITILRPISNITFLNGQSYNTSCLSQLSLEANYTLIFSVLPRNASINLKVLQTSPSTCKQITIESDPGTQLAISGLESARDRHPQICLKASWDLLQYLAVNNESIISVHSISKLPITQDSMLAMLQSTPNQTATRSQIDAVNITYSIATKMPCGPLDYYRQTYNSETLAKHGIIVSNVRLEYAKGRCDLYNTLEALCGLDECLVVPNVIEDEGIVCCGERLSQPWKPKWDLIIQLDSPHIPASIKYYYQLCACFCQNIHYPTIYLNGAKTPIQNRVETCIDILTIFQGITADKLYISNIRNTDEKTSKFSVAALNYKAAKYTKWNLNVETLVLDNVDDHIIYWMLGHYNFTKRTEVHILNERFTSLAIAQVLSLPVGNQITTLLINGFAGLNEVKHANNPEEIKGFSLFKYIEAKQREGLTIKDLGLHKLSLQVSDQEFESYRGALSVLLLSYGLYPCEMLFDQYIEFDSSTKGIALDRTRFTLRGVTLIRIKSDFTHRQTKAKAHAQSHPNPPQQNPMSKGTVLELVLYFYDTPLLTEADLVTIIRWVGCRFKGLVALRLENSNMSSEARAIVASRHYWIDGLNMLNKIQIQSPNSTAPFIEIPIQLYRNSLLATVSNPVSEFTAVSLTMLRRLYNDPKLLELFTPDRINHSASFQMILTQLRETKESMYIVCSICYKDISDPPVEEKEEDLDTKKSGDAFDSKYNFATLCYLKCRHPLCDKCAIRLQRDMVYNCTSCKQKEAYDNIHQLLSIPLSNFVLAEDSTDLPTGNIDWLKDMALPDQHVYFYLAYPDFATLCAYLEKEPDQDLRQIHIICANLT